MIRFTHLSDTHGIWPGYFSDTFPPSKNVDFVVHSGDMAPNNSDIPRHLRPTLERKKEEAYQENWWKGNLEALKKELSGRPFIFIRGNHDFFDPLQLLLNADINAFCVENRRKVITVKDHDLVFYGLPQIPYLSGEWNFETRLDEMKEYVEKIPECDILLAHCPPYGILSHPEKDGKQGGNSALTHWLDYGSEFLPKYILTGHMHESRGIFVYNDTVISNAATTMHTFEWRI